MKPRFNGLNRALLAGFILLIGLGQTSSSFAQEAKRRIAVITSRESMKIANLSLEELKAIYLKRLQELKGMPVVPVQRKAGSELRKAFDRLVLKSDEDRMKNFWIEEKLAGRESPPKTFDSLNSILAYLKKVPGTISYVAIEDLDEEKRKELFIIPLKVGKETVAPEGGNYPLKF